VRRFLYIDEVRKGDVVLVVGYDYYNFASGDADGWHSRIYSVAEESAVAPDGREYPDRKLVEPEGMALPEDVSNGREWIPLYQEGPPFEPGQFSLGYDGGAHACSLYVHVFLLQRGRMTDLPQGEDGFDDCAAAGTLMDQQNVRWEEAS